MSKHRKPKEKYSQNEKASHSVKIIQDEESSQDDSHYNNIITKSMTWNDECAIPRIEVEYPSEDRMNQQIAQIIHVALPPKKSLWQQIKEIYWGPGPKAIFYQCGSAWVVGMMVYLTVLLGCNYMSNFVKQKEFMALFAFPILYIAFSVISYWSEEQNEMVEFKQSMRYTFTYLISLRMFWVSIVSVMISSIVLLLVYQNKDEVWKIGAVGVSSLFLFATVSLYLYHRFGRYHHIFLMTIVWFAACYVLAMKGQQLSYVLFELMPLAVHVVVAVGCFVGYVYFIRKVEWKNAYAYTCHERLW